MSAPSNQTQRKGSETGWRLPCCAVLKFGYGQRGLAEAKLVAVKVKSRRTAAAERHIAARQGLASSSKRKTTNLRLPEQHTSNVLLERLHIYTIYHIKCHRSSKHVGYIYINSYRAVLHVSSLVDHLFIHLVSKSRAFQPTSIQCIKTKLSCPWKCTPALQIMKEYVVQSKWKLH
jgi:hypothetical protein